MKTRRTRTNKSPATPFGRNSKSVVVEGGFQVKIAGLRAEGDNKLPPSKDAKPILVARVYTGVNRGKVYPYAGKKRGGGPRVTMRRGKAIVITDPETMFEAYDEECIPGN